MGLLYTTSDTVYPAPRYGFTGRPAARLTSIIPAASPAAMTARAVSQDWGFRKDRRRRTLPLASPSPKARGAAAGDRLFPASRTRAAA